MKLAFYYHIPAVINSNKQICVPGYLGVFIDSLAENCVQLYYVVHQARSFESAECDYMLKAKNITLVDLGIKTPAWHRAIFHKKILGTPLKSIENVDCFIVRAPTPLAPYFYKYVKKAKIIFMVVGDYAESVAQSSPKTLRERIVNLYVKHNDYLFRARMKHTDVVANSPVLYKKYSSISKTIHQIKTTTLNLKDFFPRVDTCTNDEIKVLYTGRIDLLKGLNELIESGARLNALSHHVSLHIVGWEPNETKPIETSLKELATKLGVSNKVVFHGKKQIGEELNKMYRNADIYAIPSYEEGFPRTIWEAMANSMPVVATTVGAIPSYLLNNEDALLIPPKSIDALTEALNKLITDSNLRKKLIINGRKLAEDNTLEKQTKDFIKIIQKLI